MDCRPSFERRRSARDLEPRFRYAVGTNYAGQLGQGDTEPREVFTVVQKTRGLGVVAVSTNADMCFAVTADHEVLVWGGSGAGVTGIKVDPDDEWAKEMYMEPQFVTELQGEEAVGATVGASHAGCVTSGGDVFVWGHNLCGQLGLTDFSKRTTPEILTYFEQDPDIRIRQIEAGENHCACLSSQQRVYPRPSGTRLPRHADTAVAASAEGSTSPPRPAPTD